MGVRAGFEKANKVKFQYVTNFKLKVKNKFVLINQCRLVNKIGCRNVLNAKYAEKTQRAAEQAKSLFLCGSLR